METRASSEETDAIPETVRQALDPKEYLYPLSFAAKAVPLLSKPANDLVKSMKHHHEACYQENVNSYVNLLQKKRLLYLEKQHNLLFPNHLTQEKIKIVFILGDSTTQGIGCDGYHNGLGGRLAQEVFTEATVINLGVSCAHIEHLPEMFTRYCQIIDELDIPTNKLEIDFVLSIGGNNIGTIQYFDSYQTLVSRTKENVETRKFKERLLPFLKRQEEPTSRHSRTIV